MKKIDWIKSLILLSIFVLPILVIPSSVIPLGMTKQMALLFLVLITLIAALFKSIIKAEFLFQKNILFVFWGILALISFISALLSGAAHIGLWGQSGLETEAAITIVLAGIFMFLVSISAIRINSRKFKIGYLVVTILVLVFGFLSTLSINALTKLNLAQYNPFGTITQLNLFLAVSFFYFLVLARNTTRDKIRYSLSFLTLVIFVFIALSATSERFWIFGLTAFFALLLIAFEIFATKRQAINTLHFGKLFHLFFIFIVAMLLMFITTSVKFIQVAPLISLTPKATVSIASETISSSVKNALVGSGPSTFGYLYEKYKPASINLTNFWQLRIGQGYNDIGTKAVTLGILGFLAFIAFIVSALIQLARTIKKELGQESGAHLLAIIPAAFMLISLFFTPLAFPNFIWLIIVLGLFISFEQEVKLVKPSEPQHVFLSIIVSLIIITAAGLLLFVGGKKIYAFTQFKNGVITTNAGNLEKGIPLLQKAVVLDSANEVYVTNLIQALVLLIAQNEKNESLVGQNFQAIQALTQSLKTVNSFEPNHYILEGQIFESFMGNNEQMAQAALKDYETATQISLKSPAARFNLGRFYDVLFERFKDKNYKKQAIANLKEALELKPNYEEAQKLLKKIE